MTTTTNTILKEKREVDNVKRHVKFLTNSRVMLLTIIKYNNNNK